MSLLLGCIADDFTGGTDLAGTLVRHGMRTVQMIGVPHGPPPPDVDAVVVALKSRTAPARAAVAESLAALHWLRAGGARQCYFKVCSTFDSTPQGNIGPVADALMDALGTDFSIVCPAFPVNGRTVYKGHLFVGDVLLSDSGMREHPLTPMTDANLVRVLQAQTRRTVGLAEFRDVAGGPQALRRRLDALRAEGVGIAIVDAVTDEHLQTIGAACADLPLLTAGSGVGIGLPANFRRAGLLPDGQAADTLPSAPGLRAVIAGSCSTATRAQVAEMAARHPSFRVDPLALAQGEDVVGAATAFAAEHLPAGPVLVYATAMPDEVRAVQQRLGVEKAGALVEGALAEIARALVALGVTQLIVAGGETSGAVVKALDVRGLRIGPEIAPGVPWTMALAPHAGAAPLALALKSGNFGGTGFFLDAWSALR
jgi:uncharacterized protein YgbK (DUF1537 family)